MRTSKKQFYNKNQNKTKTILLEKNWFFAKKLFFHALKIPAQVFQRLNSDSPRSTHYNWGHILYIWGHILYIYSSSVFTVISYNSPDGDLNTKHPLFVKNKTDPLENFALFTFFSFSNFYSTFFKGEGLKLYRGATVKGKVQL